MLPAKTLQRKRANHLPHRHHTHAHTHIQYTPHSRDIALIRLSIRSTIRLTQCKLSARSRTTVTRGDWAQWTPNYVERDNKKSRVVCLCCLHNAPVHNVLYSIRCDHICSSCMHARTICKRAGFSFSSYNHTICSSCKQQYKQHTRLIPGRSSTTPPVLINYKQANHSIEFIVYRKTTSLRMRMELQFESVCPINNTKKSRRKLVVSMRCQPHCDSYVFSWDFQMYSSRSTA